MRVPTPFRSTKRGDGVVTRPWRGRRLSALAPFWAGLCSSAPAQAHAPPYATAIHWTESPHGIHAVIRSNRGLIFQEPKSGAFEILCGEAFGSTITEVAPFAALPDGSLFVASYEGGLQRSSPDRCRFEAVSELSGAFVADLQRSPRDPEDLFALSLPLDGSAAALINRRGALAPWVTLTPLEGAPDSVRVTSASSQRVYLVSMRSEGERQIAEVLNSSDHGHTFSSSSLSLNEHEIRAYLLDAEQADPERVFLRTQTADGLEPERLMLSEDGGVTFREVLRARGPLTLASRAEDDTLWIGTFTGLFRSDDQGASFTQVEGGPERIECLRVHDGRLYVCGYAEGEFGVLASDLAAAEHFNWFLRFPDVRARVPCPADSDEERACQYPFEDWAAEQLQSLEEAGAQAPATPSATAGSTSTPRSPTPIETRSQDSPGCSLHAEHQGASQRAWVTAILALWARRRAFRRSTPGTAPRRH